MTKKLRQEAKYLVADGTMRSLGHHWRCQDRKQHHGQFQPEHLAPQKLVNILAYVQLIFEIRFPSPQIYILILDVIFEQLISDHIYVLFNIIIR